MGKADLTHLAVPAPTALTARDIFEPAEMLLRAQRDVYYRSMLTAGADVAALKRAGLFVDSLTVPVCEHPSFDVQYPTTPVGKTLAGLKRLRQPGLERNSVPVVLLSTGSFSPVHRGHVSMMEAAREALEAKGYWVVGGYLSPSHDEYVSTKQGGAAAMHCEDRIALLEEALVEHPWLSVCPWEARYAPVALNFTDVVLRLTEYLARWLKEPVQVAYVFGSDNVEFLEAFRERGMAVCVQRGALDEVAGQYKARSQLPQPHLHWVEPTAQQDLSSSRVRAGHLQDLPDGLARNYERRRAGQRAPQAQAELSLGTAPSWSRKQQYLVRDDLRHGTKHWGANAHVQGVFNEILGRELRRALQGTAWEVSWLSLEAQQGVCSEWKAPFDASGVRQRPVLSLDVAVQGHRQLQLSREFELSSGQVRSRSMVTRPGTAALPEQLAQLDVNVAAVGALAGGDAGKVGRQWLVVDDDQATGQTSRYVEELLASRGDSVEEFRYFNEALLARQGLTGADIADVVDARDFLLGARDGGLVVSLPDGELGRAPYMFPFVNLAFRAKLPARHLMRMSLALWRLNWEWFTCYAPELRVADADLGARRLLLSLGFSEDLRLSEVCRPYLTYLQSCSRG